MRKKHHFWRTTIVNAIHHRDLFGSLPAFSSLDTWQSWITWLKAVFCSADDGR
jgi:hypothetical protein